MNQDSIQLSLNSLQFSRRLLRNYPPHQYSSSPYSHMHDYRKEREIFEKTTSEKLQSMSFFKQTGNDKFRVKEYDQALYFYQKAIVFGDYTFPEEAQDIAEMELLLQQVHVNFAIASYKLDKWKQAQEHLHEAKKFKIQSLEHPLPKQFHKKIQKINRSKAESDKKAYYWLTKVYTKQSKYAEAKAQITHLEESSWQADCSDEIQELKLFVESQLLKDWQQNKQFSKNIFALQT